MDTKTLGSVAPVEPIPPSRLPAGSTLLVNGIHVPHPHAEANLPGQPDPRLGLTEAVTETVKVVTDGDGKGTSELISEPLHDEVKPTQIVAAVGSKQLVVKEEPSAAIAEPEEK